MNNKLSYRAIWLSRSCNLNLTSLSFDTIFHVICNPLASSETYLSDKAEELFPGQFVKLRALSSAQARRVSANARLFLWSTMSTMRRLHDHQIAHWRIGFVCFAE